MEDNSNAATVARLEQDRHDTTLDAFTHDTAWRLGSLLRDMAVAAGHGVIIDIRRPSGAVLFRSALAGTTIDQDMWIERKAAVALRFETSSALIAARFAAAGVDAAAMGWLPADRYAVTGGAVAIHVDGVGLVGAVTVSGLSSDEDHELAMAALRRLRSLS